MIRSFQFKPVQDDSQPNWSILTQNTAIKLFTPVLTNFTGDDITKVRGYYILYGPMVFITIHLKSDGTFGWDSGATVGIPVEPYNPTNEEFPQAINPVVNITTSLAVNDEHPIVTPVDGGGVITLQTAETNLSEINLTGFYLRN